MIKPTDQLRAPPFNWRQFVTQTFVIIHIIIIITRPRLAFSRLGLGGSLGVKTLWEGKLSKNVTHKQALHHYIYIYHCFNLHHQHHHHMHRRNHVNIVQKMIIFLLLIKEW